MKEVTYEIRVLNPNFEQIYEVDMTTSSMENSIYNLQRGNTQYLTFRDAKIAGTGEVMDIIILNPANFASTEFKIKK